MPYKRGKGDNEEVISTVEDFGPFVWKHGLHWPWMNLHALLIEAHLLGQLKERLSRHKMWWLILLNVAGVLKVWTSPRVCRLVCMECDRPQANVKSLRGCGVNCVVTRTLINRGNKCRFISWPFMSSTNTAVRVRLGWDNDKERLAVVAVRFFFCLFVSLFLINP